MIEWIFIGGRYPKIKELLDKTGAFYAFGEGKFNKLKKDGVKYVRFGDGLCCPVEKAYQVEKEIRQIKIDCTKKDMEENGERGIICREYFELGPLGGAGNIARLKNILRDYIDLYPDKFTDNTIAECCRNCDSDFARDPY
jgi:hypothetical protein